MKARYIVELYILVLCGAATINAMDMIESKPVEHELLCKQVYEIKSKFNIVLECIEVNK
jgi:hypothetical protein